MAGRAPADDKAPAVHHHRRGAATTGGVPMAATVQSNTRRTLSTLAGDPVPAIVNQGTDLNDLPLAASVYMRLNEGRTATDTVLNIFDAMRDSNAVVALYADGNGVEARVIWPDSIALTRDNNIT